MKERATKYLIRFDKVDKRINMYGIENYKLFMRTHFIADTKDAAMRYVKELFDEIKELHLTNESGLEYSLIWNVWAKRENDFETCNTHGDMVFEFNTPNFKKRVHNKEIETHDKLLEIDIRPIEVMEIK